MFKKNKYLIKLIFKNKIYNLWILAIIIAIIQFFITSNINNLTNFINYNLKKFIENTIILLIFCFIYGIFKYFLSKNTYIKEKKCNQFIINDILLHSFSISNEDIENFNFSNWLGLINLDSNNLSNNIVFNITDFFTGFILFISAVIYGFLNSWILMIFLFFLTILSIFLGKFISKETTKKWKIKQEKQGIVQQTLLSIFNNKLLLNIFNSETFGENLFKENYENFTKIQFENNKIKHKVNSLGIFQSLFFDTLVGIFSIFLIYKNYLTIGQFISFNLLMPQFVWIFYSAPYLYNNYLQNKGSLERIEIFLNINKIEKNEKRNISKNKILNLNNISFSYEEKEVLKNINFSLYKNEKIVISGESGSGKSTLLKILCQLYIPKSGVYEKNLENIGFMPQKTEIFNLSLKENILLGRNIEKYKFEEILNISGISKILNKFENGLDTILINNEKMNLSAGELQKIGIARALINSDILILDEPLANLDKKSEIEISQILKVIEQPVIIVSHRNDYLKENFKYYTLENGILI